ncbi:MAG: hypothetical protein GY794_08655 [bacterium]|nr:hypothetical protein [bacterium]
MKLDKYRKLFITGSVTCMLAVAVLMMTAQPATSHCGACGSKSKTAAKKAVVAGTGYSTLSDAKKAGVQAATEAKKAIGKVKPKLVLVFGMFKNFDQAKALEGVTSVFDAGIVHGCSAYNTMTQKDNNGTVSVLALGGKIGVTPVIADVSGNFQACGKKIGEALKKPIEVKHSGKVVILLGDCHVPSNDKVVKGIAGVIGKEIPIVGAAAVGGTSYFKGKIAGKGKNIGILITGDFLVGCSTLDEGPADVHPNKIIAAAGQAFKNAVGKNVDRTALVFAFDCGGRRGKLGKNRPEELKAMQAVVGKKTPLIGFYGSGEMGPKACGQPSAGVGFHISACALINK